MEASPNPAASFLPCRADHARMVCNGGPGQERQVLGREQERPAHLARLLHLQWEAGNRIGPVQWLRAPPGTSSWCRVPAGGSRDIPEAGRGAPSRN